MWLLLQFYLELSCYHSTDWEENRLAWETVEGRGQQHNLLGHDEQCESLQMPGHPIREWVMFIKFSMCMWIHDCMVRVCVFMSAWVPVWRLGDNLCVLPPMSFTFPFSWDRVSHWPAVCQVGRLMAAELGPNCLLLPYTGITTVCPHARPFPHLSIGDWTQTPSILSKCSTTELHLQAMLGLGERGFLGIVLRPSCLPGKHFFFFFY